MNAENAHQLFGGEISDHFKIQGKLASDFTDSFFENDQKLGNIYSNQVKPVGQINVTSSPINMSVESLIERQPDPLIQQLQATLAKIAQQHNLTPDNKVNTEFKLVMKDQSADDIQQANDAVMKALEELKSLGEL